MSAVLLLLGVSLVSADGPDDSSLGLADLPAYRAALGSGSKGPAVGVGFREVWDHPGRYRGRRVEVEGRIERRFRQGPVGTFPALTEVWIVSPAGDPFCLVFPTREPVDEHALGASARFTGMFLKRVRYQAGDTARLAPLIVGSQPPVLARAGPPGAASEPGFTRLDWRIGIAAMAVVASILARQFLGRPRPRRVGPGPPPEFWSPGAAGQEDTRHETRDARPESWLPGAAHDVPSDT
jgi:hypothetical protein